MAVVHLDGPASRLVEASMTNRSEGPSPSIDGSLTYLQRMHAAREGTDDADWERADRFLQAARVLLGLEHDKLSLKGIQAVSALAIELAEEIGHRLP